MISGTVSTLAVLFLLEGFLADEATKFKGDSFLAVYLGVLTSSFWAEAFVVDFFEGDFYWLLTDWEKAAA